MYVKLYQRILDSSLAENRRLRHFFTDMLLCADPDGNVTMTKDAIKRRTGASLEEVEWGIEELLKPDPGSLTPDNDGRRIVPLEGHAYGWRITNYSMYRDFRSSTEMRKATSERVRRWREKQAAGGKGNGGSVGRTPRGRGKPLAGESAALRTDGRGAEAIAAESVARFDPVGPAPQVSTFTPDPPLAQVSTFTPDPPLAQVSTKEPEAVPVIETADPAVSAVPEGEPEGEPEGGDDDEEAEAEGV